MSYAAHNINNYQIGKGILYFDRWDDDLLPTGLRDLGNCNEFNLSAEVEEKTHESHRGGIVEVDLTVVLKRVLKVTFTIDEYDPENLSLYLFGSKSGDIITIFDKSQLRGQLKIIGTNDVGPKYIVNLWDVTLKPTNPLPFISNEWGILTFEASVQKDTASHPSTPYGTVEEIVAS